ncbi:hypothetical protein JNN96_20480 [Mycobacterium sp. DSM 3803]|nr:hypothetical protein [Mycobacterium sp. DSM 3803]
MTSQASGGWRRVLTGSVAGGALAVGLLMGVGAGTAHADVLDDVYNQYATGAGGGQVSNWAKESMQLRALGFRPSKGNIEALQESLKYRPNQTPLIDALKATVSYQRKIQAQSQNAAPGGVNQSPYGPNYNSGIGVGPSGGGIQIPIG